MGVPDIPKVRTIKEIKFPIVVTTEIEIECIPGHEQVSGSSVITCVKDTNFDIEEMPTCVIGGFLSSLN